MAVRLETRPNDILLTALAQDAAIQEIAQDATIQQIVQDYGNEQELLVRHLRQYFFAPPCCGGGSCRSLILILLDAVDWEKVGRCVLRHTRGRGDAHREPARL